MAILAVQGDSLAGASLLFEERGGVPIQEDERLRVFGFHSPTDAVLSGIQYVERSGKTAVAAVTAGEVRLQDGGRQGACIQAAEELVQRARPGETLILEAVYFAMNRNEVDALLHQVQSPESLPQRVFLANPKRRTPAGEGTSEAASAGTAGSTTRTWLELTQIGLLLVLVGLLVKIGFAGGPESIAEGPDQLYARKLFPEAAAAYLHAYEEDPGKISQKHGYLKATLAAIEEDRREDRSDHAFRRLQRALEIFPGALELENIFLDVGAEHLDQLLERRAVRAFEETKQLYLDTLPLSEQEAAHRLVGIQARRIMERWSTAESGRRQGEIEKEFDPLWKLSPDHPELRLATSEIQMRTGHFRYMVENLEKVLEVKPDWVDERPKLSQLVMGAFERMDTTYDRKGYADSLLSLVIERFGGRLEVPMQEALGSEAVGARYAAFRYLKARDKLTDLQAEDYHRANLRGTKRLEAKEDPLADPLISGQLLDFLEGLEGPPRARFLPLAKVAWQRALPEKLRKDLEGWIARAEGKAP